MKNVINIVLDAFCYNNLENKIGNMEVTPFLNKLAKNSISFTNIYSQAPYTEASQIALLGGENTLENGGYLFGNANVKTPIMEEYQKVGYKTILGYSPYVCSKAYLKGVSTYKYTRLFSIQPCFDYRLNYFRDKKFSNEFKSEYYEACIFILDEAFNSWLLQCNSIINNESSSEMIKIFVKDDKLIIKVRNELEKQKSIYESNKIEYINIIFNKWKQHVLFELSNIYNKKNIKTLELLKTKYNLLLEKYQKKYEKLVLNKLHIDFSYITGMFFNNIDKKDALRTLKNYYIFKFNKNLSNYLNLLNSESKCEVSIHTMINFFYEEIKKSDDLNENYYLYFQPQDFHLPSLFHTFDINDIDVIDKEFELAFSLLEGLDSSYKGNIIADLSARLCDYKLEQFYTKLKANLKNDFVFVVMADHGYPSYYNPPRPIIYNQTYTEAFHIPFIVNSNSIGHKKIDGLFSILDGIELVKQIAGINNYKEIIPKDFIISEYSGPGCPMINEKKIWYTIITKSLKLSAEVFLGKQVTTSDIINIYNIEKDPLQKKNLRKHSNKLLELDDLLTKITTRNLYLGKKFKKESYLIDMINNAVYES